MINECIVFFVEYCKYCGPFGGSDLTVQACPAVSFHLLSTSHNVSLSCPSHHWWPSTKTHNTKSKIKNISIQLNMCRQRMTQKSECKMLNSDKIFALTKGYILYCSNKNNKVSSIFFKAVRWFYSLVSPLSFITVD